MTEPSLTYWSNGSFYVNPSSRCTNDCLFCVRNFGDGVYDFNLRMQQDPTPEELEAAIRATLHERFQEAAIVGLGEPLLNLEGVLSSLKTVKHLRSIPTRMNTNGHARLIHPNVDVAKELFSAGLDHVQVSLNAHNNETYLKLCRPTFGADAYPAILGFARNCLNYMTVELSVVDLPGVDIDACKSIAHELGTGFRIRPFKGPIEKIGEIGMVLTGSPKVGF